MQGFLNDKKEGLWEQGPNAALSQHPLMFGQVTSMHMMMHYALRENEEKKKKSLMEEIMSYFT